MILERVVNEQIEKYMERHNLLGKNQHGFRGKRSTVSAILSMDNQWREDANKGKYTGILLYDLSAAFDCLDPEILSEKLKLYGFNEHSRKWVTSYLTGRKQIVKIGNSYSSPRTLPFGSPQGSCLSPMLFIILLADIEDWANEADVFGFADDTTNSVSGDSVEEVDKKLEEEAIIILQFMASNNLVINPDKTGFLLYKPKKGNQEEQNIRVGSDVVVESPVQKLLGMKISADLNWSEHIQSVIKALNHRLFVIRRLKEVLPQKTLSIVGEAIFNSHIRYGLAAYGKIRLGEEPVNCEMKRLQVLQNELMRLIVGKRKKDCVSVKTLLEMTGYMSVNQMAVTHTLSEVFNVINNDMNPGLKDTWTEIKSQATMKTRFQEKENLNIVRFKKSGLEGFQQRGPVAWNSLPEDIRNTKSKETFKRKVKKWIVNVPV